MTEPTYVWQLWYCTNPDDPYEGKEHVVGLFSSREKAFDWLEGVRQFESESTWTVGDISQTRSMLGTEKINNHWSLTRRMLDRPVPEDKVFADGAILFGFILIDESPDNPESQKQLAAHRELRAKKEADTP